MGVGIVFDDGIPTAEHEEIGPYLVRARQAAIGKRVTAIKWDKLELDGRELAVLRVVLEDGQSLVLFAPMAYGLTDRAGRGHKL